jgi:hypothetical protein
MDEPVVEIARRIAAARFSCKDRHLPCSACRSAIFTGCYHLAEAVLTPILEPEYEQGGPL